MWSNRTVRVALWVSVACFLTGQVVARADEPNELPTAEVIRRFAEAESRNMVARNNYTFTQDVDLMTVGEAGSITGRYRRTSDIVYDNLGNRIERITFFPPSTLVALSISREDLQDLAGVQPFALTTEDLPNYVVTYAGKERIDELNTYVFDVRPRKYEKGERYLEGRVWVDDVDLQIVKVAGKGVPEVGGQKFPRFETFRENIDGRYWFPTYTYSDDVLEFRNPVRLRMVVRYTNYKKFSTDIRIGDDGEVAEEEVKPAKPPESAPAERPQLKDHRKPEKPPR